MRANPYHISYQCNFFPSFEVKHPFFHDVPYLSLSNEVILTLTHSFFTQLFLALCQQ